MTYIRNVLLRLLVWLLLGFIGHLLFAAVPECLVAAVHAQVKLFLSYVLDMIFCSLGNI